MNLKVTQKVDFILKNLVGNPSSRLIANLSVLKRPMGHLKDLEPARTESEGKMSEEIAIRMPLARPFQGDIKKLTANIFGRCLTTEAAIERISKIISRVGFADDISIKEEAKIILALAWKWEEVVKLMSCPDGVERRLIFGLTDNHPHTTCGHRDDLAYVKIRCNVLSRCVFNVAEEILPALGTANEVMLVPMNDNVRLGALTEMFASNGKQNPKDLAEGFFGKNSAIIRYSNRIPHLMTEFIHNRLDVDEISRILGNRGVGLPLLGIVIDFCSHEHSSFIQFDNTKRIALVVVSNRPDMERELKTGIFDNIFSVKMQLWVEPEREKQASRSERFESCLGQAMSEKLISATSIKATTPLRKMQKIA